jgi:hypothetical protein
MVASDKILKTHAHAEESSQDVDFFKREDDPATT